MLEMTFYRRINCASMVVSFYLESSDIHQIYLGFERGVVFFE